MVGGPGMVPHVAEWTTRGLKVGVRGSYPLLFIGGS